MSKDDYVKVFIRGGELGLLPFEVVARKSGRKIDLEVDSKEVTASEITRGGTLIKKIQFPRSEVIAIESVISE